MSHTLYWEPVKQGGVSLPDALKFALREQYGFPVDEVLDESDLGFVEGLVAAKVPGAVVLHGALGTHGRVHVQERC